MLSDLRHDCQHYRFQSDNLAIQVTLKLTGTVKDSSYSLEIKRILGNWQCCHDSHEQLKSLAFYVRLGRLSVATKAENAVEIAKETMKQAKMIMVDTGT